MARNRKRAKERRARRPQPVGTARSQSEETPSPIGHAAPDVELAEAQLALGRPDLIGSGGAATPAPDDEFEDSELDVGGPAAGDRTPLDGSDFGGEGPPSGGGGAGGEVAGPRPRAGSRLIGFLQGSWRELQRVQWPDRRQVMQATGVVIGFVIIAGVFLGVADTLASHVMNYILNGHW